MKRRIICRNSDAAVLSTREDVEKEVAVKPENKFKNKIRVKHFLADFEDFEIAIRSG